jgi:hypothetical protein
MSIPRHGIDSDRDLINSEPALRRVFYLKALLKGEINFEATINVVDCIKL